MGLVATSAVVLAAVSVPRSARVSVPWLGLSMVLTGVVLNSVVAVTSTVISVLRASSVLFVISRRRACHTPAVCGFPPPVTALTNIRAAFAPRHS